jgi:hypothetical protein
MCEIFYVHRTVLHVKLCAVNSNLYFGSKCNLRVFSKFPLSISIQFCVRSSHQ